MINITYRIHEMSETEDRYKVWFESNPDCWASGRTYDEALGSLLSIYRDKFNVEIKKER